uniref:protein DA1-related 3-like n=1 Tax=Erigeron canadensis TaxID=72917 RepID=UPI001CB9CCDE|nr:protein DA1-related 3-like [Erigeron canadensis]XP_043608465.1 protein DA1-related 3-like [Erigeron canadensis]
MDEFAHLKIQLKEIKVATGNFGNKVIGIGGFGKVYKGTLSHSKGRSMVAIKRLDRRYGQGDLQFLRELSMLSRYTHRNLISLLGFCDEDDEKIIVYEYACNGSLDRHLSSPSLTWMQRIKICINIANGLSYLHDHHGSQRVLHRDIKSSNILLDADWNAKISDMGLSKLGPANQQYTFVYTNIVGTPGYCDPQYMHTYKLTKESDIYSFGVVLFEVLCGKLCFNLNKDKDLEILVPSWKRKYKHNNLQDIVFQDLRPSMNSNSLETFSSIAFKCLHDSREQRPTISQVVEKLERALEFQAPHDKKDERLSMSGNYPYHKSWYKEHSHQKCYVCQNFIPTNAGGLNVYRAHPFWAQKYCPFHEHDGTPRCCSCERMLPRESISYASLNDGRKLCSECLDSSVLDTNECQPLYLDIQAFYESLNMKVEEKFPLLLVERQTLNEAMDGHYHMPERRGLCLSEGQTTSTVLRRLRIGMGNQVRHMRTKPFKLTRRCEVIAILILYGLPRLLTGSILAHEMMHAWLRLEGYGPLISQEEEEGICQVLAHMWLRAQIAATSSRQEKRSPFDKKLAEFFKHQIESDMSPVFGNGFRAGNQAVLKYGFRRTLDHIRLTGTFPS